MATTMFFEKNLKCKVDPKNKMSVEFGRSSYTGENLMYLLVDGKSVMIDKKTCVEIFDAMADLDAYLNLRERS